jgi:muramidase (phage lysozyme)
MISALIFTAVFAGGSPDHSGYEESLYQGKWYVAAHEPIRKCIMWRESRHNYRAANPTSSARGAYQFLDRAWRDSLVWMLRPEHKNRVPELQELRNKPINKWSRYWQDAAFWVAWRKGEGKQHWSLQRKECW